jgi:hypothetical protein
MGFFDDLGITPEELADLKDEVMSNFLNKPLKDTTKKLVCPLCETELFKDPIRLASHCANAGCDFPYVVPEIALYQMGVFALREALITGVHSFPTIFDFYQKGVEDTWAEENPWESDEP